MKSVCIDWMRWWMDRLGVLGGVEEDTQTREEEEVEGGGREGGVEEKRERVCVGGSV